VQLRIVLARGYERFLDYEAGARAFAHIIEVGKGTI